MPQRADAAQAERLHERVAHAELVGRVVLAVGVMQARRKSSKVTQDAGQ